MGRLKQKMRFTWQALLALGVFALGAAAAEASGIGFLNDTTQPIYVQGSTVVNGQVKRGPLMLVKPGQTAWDGNLANGKRTIAVYNTANQVLFQGVWDFQGNDLLYSVVPVNVPRGQPPRVELRSLDIKKMPMPTAK